jgi:alpha-beta hydrolase superfamily lysophospholipase
MSWVRAASASLFVAALLARLPAGAAATPPGVWLEPAPPRGRAVALLLHGLNLRPEKMDPLGHTLRRRGVEVYRAALPGHEAGGASMAESSRADALSGVREAFDQAAGRARALGAPLYLAAFSLGATVSLDLALGQKDVRFDRMVLLAPGSAPRYERLLRTLRWLAPKAALPSLAPASHRVRNTTPLAAYGLALDSAAALRERKTQQSNLDVPALVLVDPRDRVIHAGRLRADIAARGLPWRVVDVHARGRLARRTGYHLIVDPEAVGEEEWGRMTDEITRFLEPPASPAPR